ncbi:MAG TPA: HigA family addiction module antitoxin [Beijerinckiaceae bacterium]|nr:HigA family addiction module antitoxin [Beijerinckiaceae bacterium]
MTEYPAIRNQNRCPTHPGAILRDVIEAIGKSKTEIAETLGISRQQLYDILTEKKPVSPQIAVRIGKLAGNGGAVWLRLQCEHDIWNAEREIDTSQIPTVRQHKRQAFDDKKLRKRVSK